MHVSAANGHLEIVKLLLERGADIHAMNGEGQRPYQESLAYGKLEVADYLRRNGAGRERFDIIVLWLDAMSDRLLIVAQLKRDCPSFFMVGSTQPHALKCQSLVIEVHANWYIGRRIPRRLHRSESDIKILYYLTVHLIQYLLDHPWADPTP